MFRVLSAGLLFDTPREEVPLFSPEEYTEPDFEFPRGVLPDGLPDLFPVLRPELSPELPRVLPGCDDLSPVYEFPEPLYEEPDSLFAEAGRERGPECLRSASFSISL